MQFTFQHLQGAAVITNQITVLHLSVIQVLIIFIVEVRIEEEKFKTAIPGLSENISFLQIFHYIQ